MTMVHVQRCRRWDRNHMANQRVKDGIQSYSLFASRLDGKKTPEGTNLDQRPVSMNPERFNQRTWRQS